MKKIKDFTLEEYQALKDTGMFWEFYPEATGMYKVDVELSRLGEFKFEQK